ncbi:MAG: BCCT family transporter, partial [Reichenbachiella sp.]
MKNLNPKVFFPPIVLLIITIVFAFVDNAGFVASLKLANQWILMYFHSVFAWAAFAFLVVVVVIYFSPLAKVRIGGKEAKPFLSRWKWFSITLCTTIATGILFWGTAEPIFHLNEPPVNLGLEPLQNETANFAMASLLMHWTFIPYAMYTLAGLVFALSFYNLKQPFRLGSMLFPLLGKKSHGTMGTMIEVICLFGLIAGMAASLGTGILSFMGGVEFLVGWEKSNLKLGVITLAIVGAFVLSAISGLHRGIALLSDINMKGFIVLAIFVFLTGSTLSLLEIGFHGLIEFFWNFVPRSLNIGNALDQSWFNSWTVFNWANWLAWAPVTALFLGRLSYGYTVREFIHFNLIIPSIFGGVWMMIFGGSALLMDMETQGQLYQSLQTLGAESIVYQLISTLPIKNLVTLLFLFLIFMSYVTAADSNTSAMSALSTKGITPENQEAPTPIKIIWGILIGVIAWVMIATVGIEGIKMTSILGGFPILFLMIVISLAAIKLMFSKS